MEESTPSTTPTQQEPQISPIKQYAETAKKIFIGSLVTAVLCLIFALVAQGGVEKAARETIYESSISTSHYTSFDEDRRIENAQNTAIFAIGLTYLASGVTGISCLAWIGSSMLVAYKES